MALAAAATHLSRVHSLAAVRRRPRCVPHRRLGPASETLHKGGPACSLLRPSTVFAATSIPASSGGWQFSLLIRYNAALLARLSGAYSQCYDKEHVQRHRPNVHSDRDTHAMRSLSAPDQLSDRTIVSSRQAPIKALITERMKPVPRWISIRGSR